MSAVSHQFKSIVTALCLAVGISLPAAAQQAAVADLLEQLRQAEPGADQLILSQIFTEWSRSGSPAIDLLLRRGEDALEAGDARAAVEHFTAAIDHAPDFAEAYHGRARAYYTLGLAGPALDDLRETLVLNPDHFPAMQGFAVMLEEVGRKEDALEIYRRVRQIHPADADTAGAVERLERELEGQAI